MTSKFQAILQCTQPCMLEVSRSQVLVSSGSTCHQCHFKGCIMCVICTQCVCASYLAFLFKCIQVQVTLTQILCRVQKGCLDCNLRIENNYLSYNQIKGKHLILSKGQRQFIQDEVERLEQTETAVWLYKLASGNQACYFIQHKYFNNENNFQVQSLFYHL